MKKIISLLLVLLTMTALFASCQPQSAPTANSATGSASISDAETSTPDGTSQTAALPTEAETTPETTPSETEEYVDNYVDNDDGSDKPEIIEHVMLKEVPSSFTLVGTKHLPPIDNQGGIGSCASEAITYMQFTNAVSRFVESKDLDKKWDPSSGKEQYIFAPKFTYNFAGAGTAWVYDVLKDHGALPLKDCQFYSENGYKYGTSTYNRKAQTLSWPVGEGELEQALDYRIKSYEQIWTSSFKNQLTDSDVGKELIYKIKDAVVQGNVVVTGGFSSSWQYEYVSSKDARAGSGKVGEAACVWCNGRNGGHQVSIVGYDDDFVCTFNGVQLKGAFQVANSWGEGWMNNGYFWVMYDSVNKISEYPELNLEDRENSMDQFCFIYWDKDVVIGKPDAYVTVEMSIMDREGFYIDLTKTDRTDACETFTSALFHYGANFENVRGSRDAMKFEENYMTFSGNVDNGEEKGYVTLGYQGLLNGMSFDDFKWGVNIYATTSSVTVHSITLYDGTGAVRARIVPPADRAKIKYETNRKFVFDLGNELRANHEVGSYKLKNLASGLYIAPVRLALKSGDSFDEAAQFVVTFDYINRNHVIYIADKPYVLDLSKKKIEDGTAVQFNVQSRLRNTQTWKVVKNEDGTYNVRLAADTRYALGMVDGKIVLVSGVGVRDYGTWIFENAGNPNMFATVTKNDDGKAVISGKIPDELNLTTLSVGVYSAADGTPVKTYTVVADQNGEFSYTADDLANWTYLFMFEDEKGAGVSACYYRVLA